MRVIDWLFNRSEACFRLRERADMHARQADCLLDVVSDERGKRIEGRLAMDEMCEKWGLLQAECDGYIRELWMERRRMDEQKADFEQRYHELSRVCDLLRTRLEHSESTVRLRERDIGDLLRRIENLEAAPAEEGGAGA